MLSEVFHPLQELIYAALVPHPPIVVPAVGKEEGERVQATRRAMEEVAARLAALRPDGIVIITPHGPVFHDAVAVHMVEEIGGDLAAFGAPEVALSVPVDRELGEQVISAAREAGIMTAPVTEEWIAEWEAERLDHGSVVPLYFLQQAGWRSPVLPVAMGILPPVQLYAFGMALGRAIDRSGRRIAVLASGDLSHRLTPEAPAGHAPGAERFDQEVVEALEQADMARLFRLDPDLVELAGECGLRPLMMLAGALDGIRVEPRVLSYEGPFGVGYAVAELRPAGPDPERALLERLQRERKARVERRRARAHPLVRLARAALEHYVETGMALDFSSGAPHEGTAPLELPAGLPERAGVFVTLRIDGDLRGCMGTTTPTEPSLALEVVRSAIDAGTADPRFLPVEDEELPYLDYTVHLVEEPEPCTAADLDPQVYGVIAQAGGQSGVLLPGLPGIRTAQEQLELACRKAGVRPDDPELRLFRFRVRRFW